MVLRRLGAFFAFAFVFALAERDADAQQQPTDTTGGGATPPVSEPQANTPSSTLIPPEPAATGTSPTTQPQIAKPTNERPVYDGTIGERPSEVYSEDWWAHTRPVVEMHGYFRTRGELFHNFALGRHTAPGGAGNENLLWPHPLDHT